MAKKQFFAIIDTETTINDTVADFACIIVDRQGNIHNQCAVMVKGHYDSMELFHDKTANDIYYEYCKDHFRGEPSDVVPYSFCCGMILLIGLHMYGIL